MRLFCFFAVFSFALTASTSFGAENKEQTLELSIYNGNLALVKDVRSMDLAQGENSIAFEGVASDLKPESVIIFGDGIKVLEQNYDYSLLTPANILEKSVGERVKTVVQNPQTGAAIFNKAKLVSAVNGDPVLEFDYGLETAFNGRIVYDKLPQGLYVKPTLAAKIYSTSAALKDLTLAYLTSGLSWTTNYVARVLDENKFDLTAWVALQNNSGADYKNAKIQLIAGDVHEVRTVQNFARPMMKMAAGVTMDATEMSIEDGVTPQELSGFYLFTLPLVTDLKDRQTKQVSLLERNNVPFFKEGRLVSTLYFGRDTTARFEKAHPALYYLTENSAENNLGMPLPMGVVRFYENDQDGRMQFIGSDRLPHTAKGEKMEFQLGNIFDVSVNGKILKATKKSENKKTENNGCVVVTEVWDYDTEIKFSNGGTTHYEITFKQNINKNTIIIQESMKGKAENTNLYQWRVDVPAEGKTNLTFTAEVRTENRNCH